MGAIKPPISKLTPSYCRRRYFRSGPLVRKFVLRCCLCWRALLRQTSTFRLYGGLHAAALTTYIDMFSVCCLFDIGPALIIESSEFAFVFLWCMKCHVNYIDDIGCTKDKHNF